MSRTLSPLQEAISLRVSRLERISETRLRDYLGTYFQGLEESEDAWGKEFALALELLVLYGHIRLEEHPRKGRILIDTRRRAAPQPGLSMLDAPVEESHVGDRKGVPWPFVACAASAVLAAGCSLLPLTPTQPNQVAQLPVYGDGTSFPSRIEQFFNGRNMVYRYCQDNECPSPTPKIAAPTPRVDLPRYEPLGSQRQGVAQGLSAGATDRIAKVAMPVVKPTATLVAAASGAITGVAVSAVGAAAPNMLVTLTNKETPTAGIALRADGEFTSYKGMVGFQQGSMVLDGLSRQKVAELAPAARDAERVRLRGKVATSQLSEEMKKLAVGRAYAVKVEFVKHDVDKAKIRIMSPQQSSGDNATGTVRGVDVMLDMPEKKTLSGTVKEGA
jgi:outer membrane protein OmpA-like peptidoglycan-associated protein